MASVGYQAGLAEIARSVVGMGLIICFVLIMSLIADLDQPAQGFLRVNQQGMVDRQDMMKRAAPEAITRVKSCHCE